jgi:hypothetical protein
MLGKKAQGLSPLALFVSVFGVVVFIVELRWLLAYPLNEFLHFGMLTDALSSVVIIKELPFRKCCVDLLVTNLVDRHRLFPFERLRK